MNKRHALFLTAVLGMATAQNAAPAQAPAPQTGSAALPVSQVAATDPQLSAASVSVETGSYAGPLSSLLAALARSAGYGLILDTNLDLSAAANSSAATADQPLAPAGRPVSYSFRAQPFNQVWPLLMDVYGLSYEVVQLGSQPVLRVGNTPIQRIVTLKSAEATEAATQAKLFFGTPKYTESPRQNEAGQTVGVTRTLIDVELDSKTMRIIADTRNNAVIVRGTNKEVAEVTRLLGQLDQAAGQTAAGEQAQNQAVRPVQRVYSVRGQTADITALLAAQYPTLRVTPVGQTGQLVLNGAQAQLDTALALLEQVDRPAPVTAPQNVQRVFQLVNASAEEVKAVLLGQAETRITEQVTSRSTTVTDQTSQPAIPTPSASTNAQAQQQTVSKTVSTPAQEGLLSQDAPTIIADIRTNKLIVRGTAEQVAQIAELIPQLDQVVPQINVQVRIQEVNERALQSLGLNWRATFGGFNVAVTGGTGLAATFNPTQSFLGFNIFPTLTALETQGLTRRVYDGNVTMQSGQRSLSATGGAQNASSSAAASVKSGGRLEINIPSAAGNIVRQIDYGLNLDFFSPQVAPDGTITLRVRGQVNQPATPITADSLPNLIDFTNSEAQSTITFRNGQTVLMSGLLGSTETSSSSGVPFLSSLPGIGAAFGEKRNEKTQSQLLVIITGTVVK
ncbi:secretin N-terminal domain-containing protein [Deinococcus wulumuqiensis]|uniref:Type IV piliation system protein n=1 Tax=Deinococcus wulumuqiensis TaxID=980427 RepID=A0AAV4K254_9DEIO|nr:secretin N-terminal domain-containing protein [Deinococcus wulumuqiensis]QII20738.1 secretin [Deinococcus wulumuqiensis R12]GGI73831.1 putative type IV piliation system protein [Deinococcus wulumuqiensis]GGP30426.1 putative type IV piliation system protein [Deinococcus wulumuqiensis]